MASLLSPPQKIPLLKPQPNDHYISKQCIATLVVTACCICLATLLRLVATGWPNALQHAVRCSQKMLQYVALIYLQLFVWGFKVPLRSNCRYPFFYIFVHNKSFRKILPNFNLLRTLELKNLRPPFIFLVPVFVGKGVNDVILSKISHRLKLQ